MKMSRKRKWRAQLHASVCILVAKESVSTENYKCVLVTGSTILSPTHNRTDHLTEKPIIMQKQTCLSISPCFTIFNRESNSNRATNELYYTQCKAEMRRAKKASYRKGLCEHFDDTCHKTFAINFTLPAQPIYNRIGKVISSR